MNYVTDLLEQLVRQGFPCLFRRFTGLYCPGCGGTRAARYLLQGDVGRSLWYHPLVTYVAVVVAAEFGNRLWAKWKNGKGNREGGFDFWGNYEIEVYVGIGIIAVNWVVKNGMLLIMGVKLIP